MYTLLKWLMLQIYLAFQALCLSFAQCTMLLRSLSATLVLNFESKSFGVDERLNVTVQQKMFLSR